MRHRRHAASTSPDARRPRRSCGWCRTICSACGRCTTTASPASTDRGVPSLRRSPTSSSRAESSSTASRASAATPARTGTCSRSRASAATSARAATPSASRSGRSGWDATLLVPVPHRQVVLTISKRLRAHCLYRRRLLGDIARVAARTVTAAIRMLTGERELAVGIVACLQTHGSRANWHPQMLVTDAGVGDRSDPHAPPHPRRDRGPPHALSIAPTPRARAGTFGVREAHPASHQSLPATGPTGTAQPRACEPRQRGGGHAATRPSGHVPSAIGWYTRPPPIETSIPTRQANLRTQWHIGATRIRMSGQAMAQP